MPGLGDFFNSQTMRGRANVAKATYGTFALLYVFYRLKRSTKNSGGAESSEPSTPPSIPPQGPYEDNARCPPKPDCYYSLPPIPAPPEAQAPPPPEENPKCKNDNPLLKKSAASSAQSTAEILEQQVKTRSSNSPDAKFKIVPDDA